MDVRKVLEDKICSLDSTIALLQAENLKLKEENEALLRQCKAVETRYTVDSVCRSQETKMAVDDLIKSLDSLIDSEL